MKKKILISLGVLIVLGLIALVSLYRFAFRTVSSPTGGMANTVIPGENVAVTKLYRDIKRGDIVLFKWPKNPEVLYMKRVIGLPGETIEVRGLKVFINGQELPEKRVKVEFSVEYMNASQPLKELVQEGDGEYRVFYEQAHWDTGQSYDYEMKFAVKAPFQIPPGQYFMMGDSRDNSMDSRFWGTVAQDAIVGKAYMIFSSPIPERAFLRLK